MIIVKGWGPQPDFYLSFLAGDPRRQKEQKMTGRATVQLGDVTPNNMGQIKKLNSVLFPVAYSPSFYTKLLEEAAVHPSKIGARPRVCYGSFCR